MKNVDLLAKNNENSSRPLTFIGRKFGGPGAQKRFFYQNHSLRAIFVQSLYH